MRTLFPFVILLLTSITISAQQRPQFSHYMYNLSILNPAYSNAEKGAIEAGAFYRSQWTGVTGAPKTGLLFAHGEVANRVEAGFSMLYDKIGKDISTFTISGDVSYNLRLSEKFKLSLGVKLGMISFDADFSNVNLGSGNNTTDPAFRRNIGETGFSIGTGAFLFSKNFYVGLSAPNLIRTEQAILSGNSIQVPHYYLQSGYVHSVHENLKIKPSLLVSIIENAPASIDFSVNALINKRFEVGVGYNFNNSITGLLRLEVKENISLGYSYGNISNELSAFSGGSHEVFVLFTFRTRPKTACFYDRFF